MKRFSTWTEAHKQFNPQMTPEDELAHMKLFRASLSLKIPRGGKKQRELIRKMNEIRKKYGMELLGEP